MFEYSITVVLLILTSVVSTNQSRDMDNKIMMHKYLSHCQSTDNEQDIILGQGHDTQ